MEMSNKNFEFELKIWHQAIRGLMRAIQLYLHDSNVALIDLGLRFRTSRFEQFEPELVVRFHVYQKLTGRIFQLFAQKYPQRVFNACAIGFGIDVLPVRYQMHWQPNQLKETHQPALSPILCGGTRITSSIYKGLGTLGGKVRDCQTGQPMLLSNWHVFTKKNEKSEILLPENLMMTQDCVPIANYTRNALMHHIDAAVALFNGNRACTNEQFGLGMVTGITAPKIGMPVIKSGAGSGISSGIISGIMGSSIRHWHGKRRLLSNLIQIMPETEKSTLCTFGDSGAWWLEQSTLRAVGLHFGGSLQPKFALAFSMPAVFNALQIEYAPDSELIRTENMKQFTNNIECRPTPGNLDIDNQTGIKKSRKFRWKQFFWLKLSLIVLLSCSVMAIFAFSVPRKIPETNVEKLEKIVWNLEKTIQIETIHQQKVSKILSIMELNNCKIEDEWRRRIAEEINNMTLKHNELDLELICAVITHETGRTWNPACISPVGAIGLMQIMPATGAYLAKEENLVGYNTRFLFNPVYNVRLGCRYLASLVQAYSLDAGLAAYNGGLLLAERWIKSGRAQGILYRETTNYVPAVLKIYEKYQQLPPTALELRGVGKLNF